MSDVISLSRTEFYTLYCWFFNGKCHSKLEINRNLGSSAGVGSGDFHIYRGIRRREYERQKFVLEKADMEELEKSFEYVLLINYVRTL